MSLEVDYTILRREVAETIMGYDRDPDGLSESEREQIDDSIRAGYVDFLYPENGHPWGFLRPSTTLELDSDVEDYNTPPEFGGVDGHKMYFDADDGSLTEVDNVSVNRILRQRSSSLSNTGRTRVFAVDNMPATGQGPQKSQVMVWPKPDGAYTLHYTMIVKPLMLSLENPSPWGSEEFGECLKSCVVAAAALKFEPSEAAGYTNDKMRRLAAAVAVDKRRNRGRSLGYNGDDSDRTRESFASANHVVKYGGAVYDGN